MTLNLACEWAERSVPPTSSRLYDQFRLGESRFYLVRHHMQNACATFRQFPLQNVDLLRGEASHAGFALT